MWKKVQGVWVLLQHTVWVWMLLCMFGVYFRVIWLPFTHQHTTSTHKWKGKVFRYKARTLPKSNSHKILTIDEKTASALIGYLCTKWTSRYGGSARWNLDHDFASKIQPREIWCFIYFCDFQLADLLTQKNVST